VCATALLSSAALAQDVSTVATFNTDGGFFEFNALTLENTATVSVSLVAQSGERRSAVGWYRIGAAGELLEPQILFTDPEAVRDTVELGELPADTRLGFFIVSDAYNAHPRLMSNIHRARLAFRSAGGAQATIFSRTPHLVALTRAGDARVIEAEVFHQVVREGVPVRVRRLNSDTHVHSRTSFGDDEKTVVIGFEDLRNGGDQDFDDLVVSVSFE